MSTTNFPRWIVVDDTDSRIHYNGLWFQNHQFFEGSNGPAFQNTLHSTQANASLSFSFSGTAVQVYGTYYIPSDTGVTVDCFIDNVSIGATQSPVRSSQNNWIFCQPDTLADGPHILTVNATVTANQTFRFDDIQYVPSPGVPLDSETIRVDYRDPQLQYGQGWDPLTGETSTTGSILTFNFTGISLSFYGDILAQRNSSLATYSIDGQTPINFELASNSENTATFNQKLFQTSQLHAGPHIMKVVYQGNNDSVPLRLDRFIIQNGTLPSTTTSVVPSHATPATTATTSTTAATVTGNATGNAVSGTSNPGKGSIPVGAIIGGVIGGLALIVLAILIFLLFRKRRKRVWEEEEDFSHAPSILEFPTPYNLTKVSLHTPPSISSSSSPSPLPNRRKREAEPLATVELQLQDDPPPALIHTRSNTINSQSVLFHEDSGIRMPRSTSTASALMEVPPTYSIE